MVETPKGLVQNISNDIWANNTEKVKSVTANEHHLTDRN